MSAGGDVMQAKQWGMTATILERWLYRYNGGINSRYPCNHKGCTNKLRNGRCGLSMCRLESNEDRSLTGNCLDYKENNGQDGSLQKDE